MSFQNIGNFIAVDTSMFSKHLQDYARLMGKELGSVIQNQAALFCKDMCKYSPPFAGKSPGTGLSAQAKKTQEEIVTAQINSIFKPLDKANPSQVAFLGSEAVYKEWITFHKGSSGDGDYFSRNPRHFTWEVFESKFARQRGGAKLLTTESELEKVHSGLRYKGYGGLKKSVTNHTGKWRESKFCFIVEDKKLINNYIAQKVKNIGYQKSAYFFSAQQVGDRKVSFPAWVKKASAQVQSIWENNLSNQTSPSVTVGNKIGLVVDPRYKWVLNQRANKMRNQMAAYVRKQGGSILSKAVLKNRLQGTIQLFSDD
jgi:hypothetical protein